MIAEIIAVGSEMLTPYRQDTNSLFLTEGLNELGVTVAFKTIVGDSLEHLTGAARVALARADLVILSGGLGPTEDDLTREAAAAVLGVPLRLNREVLEGLRQRFAARGIPMAPNNRKQADVLQGARVLENKNGSAPGQFIEAFYGEDRRIIVLLPGPPKELKLMFNGEVKPRLQEMLPTRFMGKRELKMMLLPESAVDARTSPIYSQYKDVETTILASAGEIQLHFQTTKPSRSEAQARVDELASRIEQEMGDDVFSSNGDSIEEVVLLMLGMRGMTLAAAESCTGGLLSERLTGVSGSSRYFLGGAVVYSPALKTLFAGVSASLLQRDGSVSEEVARGLAEGIRARTGAAIGVGITGIAGPGPGEGLDKGKPAGLVYVAVADRATTEVKELKLGANDRERVRWWATQHALEMVRRRMMTT